MLRGRSVMEGAFSCVLVLHCADAARAQAPEQRAWELLRTGESTRNATKRVAAAKALRVLIDDPLAEMRAGKALKDRNSSVRAAAAASLRNWNSKNSIALLKKALVSKDSQVSFAASESLVSLCDAAGYDFYLEVLARERTTGQGLISDHVAILKEPRKMARLGFETGIGFVPYAGPAWTFSEIVSKDYVSPVRVDALEHLAHDSDHGIEGALLGAASSKRWTVRAAALNAIAQHGDPDLLAKVVPHVADRNPAVKYTAAAAALRLSPETEVAKLQREVRPF
jgi:HEAT repeat protein